MKNDDKTAITSYSDRCLDDGAMLIAHDLEILVLVVEQGIRLADLDGRVRVGFAAQLLEELVDVIVVDVAVAASENAATSPPITETACNPDGSHGTPNPSRAQTNADNAAARVMMNAIAPTVSRRLDLMKRMKPCMSPSFPSYQLPDAPPPPDEPPPNEEPPSEELPPDQPPEEEPSEDHPSSEDESDDG